MSKNWPIWEEPGETEVYQLAQITVPYLRFLDKKIIEMLVTDNNDNYERWYELLAKRTITPEYYIWKNSPCVFPGVRRHIGKNEIAAFKSRDHDNKPEAVILDDNAYPKQIWSYVLRDGKKYNKTNPRGYQLAHMFEHKVAGASSKSKVKLEVTGNFSGSLYEFSGLFTSATNTCYAPASLLNPTDHNLKIRKLLQHIQVSLYSDICDVLPTGFSFIEETDENWHYSHFAQPQLVGDAEMMSEFLNYRKMIIDGYLIT